MFKVKYFDLDKLLKRLFISIDKSLEGIKCTQPLDHIVLFHLCRSIRLTKGILKLSLAGYAWEGQILLRSQFNSVVNLKWLTLKDVTNRVQRFIDFESINKQKGADNLINFSSARKLITSSIFLYFSKSSSWIVSFDFNISGLDLKISDVKSEI